MNMNYMKYERKISIYSFITILISFHYIIYLCNIYVTKSRSRPIYATFTACKAYTISSSPTTVS